MIIEVKVPVFAESITEGTLIEWRKQVGESVVRDEILVDIETDKVVLDVPAPQAGVLVEILVQNGETVGTEQLLAKIDTRRLHRQTHLPRHHKSSLHLLPRLCLYRTRKLALLCLLRQN